MMRMPRSLLTIVLATLSWLTLNGPTSASDAVEDAGCGSCHRLEPPSAQQRAAADFASRRAPELHYAGNKYKPEWLQTWLQGPRPLRPSGLHPEEHVKSIDGTDQLDVSKRPPHPAVSPDDIEEIVAALLKRKWGAQYLPEKVARTSVPLLLARLNFIKFKGCGSCHQTGEDYGGLSGPELYTAWQRLRPEFIWSYIADPQTWDPVTPMPGYSLPDQEVGKLVEFLRLIGEENMP